MPDTCNSNCSTVLLDDLPTNEDSFRHKAISHAIAEMIVSEPGGRAIALTGPWGAGKSTVIKLLEEELTGARIPIRVIVFDAWAHQGDPLRRTFIEYAMRCLSDWRPPAADWKKRLDILSRKWSETITESKPNLSTIGAIGAICLLLAPVANQLSSSTRLFTTFPAWLSWLLFILTASPLIVGIGIFVRWLWLYWFKNSAEPLPSLIYSASENRLTTSSSKTPEPTSIEFTEAYKSLLDDAVGLKDRRVLFVIDNLDRVSTDDAKAVWATLKAFFETPLQRSPWYEKIWLAVPFDETAIARIWSASSNPPDASTHFIQKTFQAFFRVPSANLSSWEAYFFEQIALAFPDHSEEGERQTVFRLFESLRGDTAEAPTPRQIKLFLNTVGSLHRQWRGVIPLSTQAAFALLSTRASSFATDLRSKQKDDLLAPNLARRLSKEWQRDLAALLFNVLPEAASETLLGYPIRQELLAGNALALKALENGAGFSQVLLDVFERDYVPSKRPDHIKLEKAALALEGVTIANIRVQEGWALLGERFREADAWPEHSSHTVAAFRALTKADPATDLAELIHKLINSLPLKDGGSYEGDLDQWVKAFAELSSELAETKFMVNIPSKDYLSLVASIRRVSDVSLVQRLVYARDASELVEALERQVAETIWGDANAGVVETLISYVPADWKDLAVALADKLDGNPSELTNPSAVVRAIFAIASLHGYEEVLFERLGSEKGLINLQYLLSDEDKEAAYKLAALIAASKASLVLEVPQTIPSRIYYNQTETIPLAQSSLDANEARRFLLRISEAEPIDPTFVTYKQFALKLFSLDVWGQSAWDAPRRELTAKMANSQPIASLTSTYLSTKSLLEERAFWREQLGKQRYEAEVQGAAERGDLSPALIAVSSPDDMLKELEIALRFNLTDAVVVLAQGLLQSMSTDDWSRELSSGGQRIDLLKALPSPLLDMKYQNALYSTATSELSSAHVEPARADAEQLVGLLNEEGRVQFYSRLANFFASESGPFRNGLGGWGAVLKQALLTNGPDGLRERVLEIVQRLDSVELSWLATLLLDWGTQNSRALRLRRDVKQALEGVRRDELDSAQMRSVEAFFSKLNWRDKKD